MKAIVYEKYGDSSVFQCVEIEKPLPKANEVRIKIKATTVSSTDVLMREAKTMMSRVFLGLTKPRKKYQVLGLEMAGVVESIGKAVSKFKVGDKVFGFAGFKPGTYSEYICMNENSALAIMPKNTSFCEAAALVDNASTALFFLKDKAKIKMHQKVLIIGASGAMGTYAVQLAKYFNAEVTGVCSAKNINLVKALGADEVLDYLSTDFAKNKACYDVIFDTAGNSSYFKSRDALKKYGIYLVTTGPIIMNYLLTFWTKVARKQKAIFAMSMNKQKHLQFIKNLVENNQLKPIVEKSFSLEQIPEAHVYIESGKKFGNIVIHVN